MAENTKRCSSKRTNKVILTLENVKYLAKKHGITISNKSKSVLQDEALDAEFKDFEKKTGRKKSSVSIAYDKDEKVISVGFNEPYMYLFRDIELDEWNRVKNSEVLLWYAFREFSLQKDVNVF